MMERSSFFKKDWIEWKMYPSHFLILLIRMSSEPSFIKMYSKYTFNSKNKEYNLILELDVPILSEKENIFLTLKESIMKQKEEICREKLPWLLLEGKYVSYTIHMGSEPPICGKETYVTDSYMCWNTRPECFVDFILNEIIRVKFLKLPPLET